LASLDASTSPKQIDIGLDDWGGFTSYTPEGRPKFTTMKGIFEIRKHPTDSARDELKWCFAMPGQPRPTDFSVSPESNHKLVELERFILKEGAAKKKLRDAGASVKLHYTHKWVEKLTLKNSDARDAPLETIRTLRKLKTLNLDAANAKIARSLSENITLMSINFDCEVAPDVLRELSVALPQLRSIGMQCVTLTPEHGKAIAQFESLISITIANNKGDVRGMEELSNKKIHALSFHHCKLNKHSLDIAISSMPNLSNLELRGCNISNSDVKSIAKVKNLWSLTIENCGLTDQGIQNLSFLPLVSRLNIDRNPVTNASMEVILRNFPELFILDAHEVDFDEGIIPTLAKVEKQLVVNVSESSVTKAQAKAAGKKVADMLRHIRQ